MILFATLAGAAGALGRYLLSGLVQDHANTDLPVGTFAVNLTGSFLIGVIAGIDNLQSTATLVSAGFLGGFTTFSTWMIETVRLGIPPLRSRAFINLIFTLLAGVVLAAVGYHITN